jgi:hypothetical protein
LEPTALIVQSGISTGLVSAERNAPGEDESNIAV